MSPKPRTPAALLSIVLFLALAAAPLLAQAPDAPGDRAKSPQVVARFLELTLEQREQWREIRRATGEAVRPLAEELRATEEALQELLGSDDPDPAEIGDLLLAIRSLKQQIQRIGAQGVADFEAILDDEQAGRLANLRRAAPLCRVVPAFRDLHLL